ncbi:unnamed protein product [Tuber melanosporum]|uniref:(Perigord truffle) hypothetical protein n=1 Tax=Tuber melanosporum (strain Mel28) TaxID=656061 RepID=D5GM85_TUBMM|nr:uncharacterized protein GSTUM_00010611001 [Tuber melanosporum]CAZ85639.1 unnamed protein product [Tuber melanosporum]
MSFGLSVGDFITGAKLAWDLYHKCFLVAKDAPNEFLELMREIGSLRGVLKCIEDEINTRRIDESRQLAIRRTMDGTTRTLRRLEALVLKYRKLWSSDGLHFWRRIGWVREQQDIEGFRVRIMVYTCTLNLCVSSVGESTINTIERDFQLALQQERLHNPDGALVSGFLRDSRRASQISRYTDQYSLSQRDGYDSPNTSPTTPDSPRPPSVRPTSPLGSVNSTTTDLIDFSTDVDQDSSAASVLDVLARASDLLSNCPDRGSILPPPVMLDWDPPSLENLVSDSMNRRFLTRARKGTEDRRIPTEDLLRTGTWWVLKSRNAVRLLGGLVPDASSTSSSGPNSGLRQAYLDLMKASWILYNYLLSDPDNTINMSDEDIRSFSTLQDAIDQDFENFRQADLSADGIEDNMMLNDKIWELKQPREVAPDGRENNPLLDPGRWLTIEDNHAGGAELGNKRVRVKTRDARYMLVLWTQEGQSELKITLCNQSGTLKISRDITPEDIRPFLMADEASNVPPAVDIEFPEMETTIHFLHICDFRKFIEIPARYFDAVQERNPISGNETEIYRRALQRLELLHPNTKKPISPDQVFHSVDLRVYETTGEEGWMTTRRLVISSSARAAQFWCTSYFLPLSGVQVRSDGAQKLTVRWSDCGQRVSAADGSFNELISYVYNEEKPNRCLGLGFGSIDDANSFEEVVSKLTLREKYRWDSTQESRYIYSIRNPTDNAERFKGLLIRHRGFEWRYSEVFYLPRDLDFELKDKGHRLRLLKAYYTNYVSDHVGKYLDLEPGKQPKFSRCEKKIDSVNLCFGTIEDAQGLLRHIADRWELKFARQIARVSYKPTNQRSFFRVATSSGFGPADLSLWKRGDTQRLVIRRSSPSSSAELYLTAVLRMDFDHDFEKMVIEKNVEIAKGELVDIATMEAVSGGTGSRGGVSVKAGQTLTIEFATVRDMEALAEVLQPSLL